MEHDGDVTICAVYAAPRWRPANGCRPGDDDQSDEDNETKVEFTVRLPAGVRLVARSVDGDIEGTGLRSDVDAETVDGDIESDFPLVVRELHSRNRMTGKLGRGGPSLRLSTIDGTIHLRKA